jgi:hypothetical protein
MQRIVANLNSVLSSVLRFVPQNFSRSNSRSFPKVKIAAWAICVTLFAWSLLTQKQNALAMGTEEKGNKPLSELNYTQWKGIMPIVNDKARVYQVWVNGNENLYYKGTTKELNVAVAAFAKLEVKNHVVVLRPGPIERRSFSDKTPIPFNWELHVISGIAMSRATDDIEDLEWQKDPVLTVYIGGNIDLNKLEIPDGVTLRSAEGKTDEAKRDQNAMKTINEFVKQRTNK